MTPLEREAKLRAPAWFGLPALADPAAGLLVDAPERIEQVATYYDTPDLRLARSGASLRYRDVDGWTVKLPADVDHGTLLVRAEHRFAGGPGIPPAEAVDLVQALVRTARLAPVARMVTLRHRIRLHDPDGRALAEVVDDEVTVLEGTGAGSRFRELEIELAGATEAGVLDALVGRLRAAGASAPDRTPKIVRVLGPAASAPSDVAEAVVTDAPGVADVVRAALTTSVARLLAHDPGIRVGGDAEDVHQARVATRRLRSHLRTFRALLDAEWASSLRDELRWLGGELGAVRDTEVLLARLEARVGELPETDRAAASRLLERLSARWAAQRAELLDAMRSPRYVELLDRLVDAAAAPRLVAVEEPDDEVLRGVVTRPWRHLRRAVEALADDPPDADLHAVRILAKRARYAAEAVEPAFGADARAFAKAVAGVQEVLGEHQDAVVAAQWLREAATSGGDVAGAFAAGTLAGIEYRAARDARAAWPAAWRAARRPRLRRWL